MEWIVIPILGAPVLTLLTAMAWYSASVLVGLPAFDPDKLGAVACAWFVLIMLGMGGILVWTETREG